LPKNVRYKHLYAGFTLYLIVILHSPVLFAGGITLYWYPPVTNVDGTPLKDLSGFNIYYGNTSGNYIKEINVGNKTTYPLSNLTAGNTYYVVVTAYDISGNESGYSNEISKTIQSPDTTSIYYYCDNDNDGYIDAAIDGSCTGTGCEPAECRTTPGNDCDDNAPNIHVGADDSRCDGIDNDCDGTADEHYVSKTTQCGIGVCESAGQRKCLNGAEINTCTPGAPTETPEYTCNDIQDNDCDGFTDTMDADCILPVTLVYQDNTPGNDVIYFNEKRLTSNNRHSLNPNIAVNGQNIYTVWQDATSMNYEIYFKRSANDGENWEKTINLSRNQEKSLHPAIAVNRSKVYVVWQDKRDGNYEIYFMKSANKGEKWSKPKRLTNNNGNSLKPAIAVNGENIYIVWQDNTGEYYEIYFMYSMDKGKNWTKKRLYRSTGELQNPDIAVQGSNIYVVWDGLRDNNDEIYFMGSTDKGKHWERKKLTGKGQSMYPAIGVNESDIYVVWQDNRDGNYEIYLRKSEDKGGSWSGSRRLTNNNGNSRKPDIKVNGEIIQVVWQDNIEGNLEILLIESIDRGVVWTEPENISGNQGRSIKARLSN
jgi:hypothetical protein